MIIHTVSQGETIFKIARKYSVQPTKIIEDNGLDGDRLTTGQELLILTPTRTVTVRGGDTLASLARRFGVRRSSLLSNNPALSGEQRLRPGHILSVKFDTPPGGASSAAGILSRAVTERRLRQVLPYLTYVIIDAYRILEDGVRAAYDPTAASELCRREGKISLLGFTDGAEGAFLLSDSFSVLDEMIALAREGGYGGISITAPAAARQHPELMAGFLMEARKRLIGCDLILFADNGHGAFDASELCDGAILSTDSADRSCNSSCRELAEYAERSSGEKTFVTLPTLAEAGDARLQYNDACRLAARVGAELSRLPDGAVAFDYRRYLRGRGEDIRISIPSAGMIKAKLDKINELGFMGISFDIESVPIWMLSMFNAYFSRADYSLLFGD